MTSQNGPSPYGNYAYATLTAPALRAPDQIAITYCGTEQVSYDALNRRVNRRTHALAAAGVKPGTTVASLLHETLNVTEVYLAEAKLGAVLAAMNPYWTDDVLVGVVEQSAAPVFLYDAHHDALVERIRPRLPGVPLWLRVGGPADGATDLDALAAASPDDEPELGAHHDDPLAYFYTSGTTGLPKAVVHTHDSSISIAQIWLDIPKTPDSVFATGPIIWGIGFTAIAGPALYGGVRLALENDFGPANFLTVAPRERVTHISVIASFWSQLLADDRHESVDLSSLRAILIGGEPLLPVAAGPDPRTGAGRPDLLLLRPDRGAVHLLRPAGRRQPAARILRPRAHDLRGAGDRQRRPAGGRRGRRDPARRAAPAPGVRRPARQDRRGAARRLVRGRRPGHGGRGRGADRARPP